MLNNEVEGFWKKCKKILKKTRFFLGEKSGTFVRLSTTSQRCCHVLFGARQIPKIYYYYPSLK